MAEQDFELIRGRIESGVERPGVIAVTSAIAGDGKSAASHGVASSLASIGYRTLLVDAACRSDAIIRSGASASVEESLLETSCDSVVLGLRIASLTNSTLQERASLLAVERGFVAIRGGGRYDYIIVDAGCALMSAFSAHLVSAADGVLVAVRAGRRQRIEDVRLSERLNELASAQFLGVLAISPSLIGSGSVLLGLRASQVGFGVRTGHLDVEPDLRSARRSSQR